MTDRKISYKKSGVDYKVLDKIKIEAQKSALKTSRNLKTHSFSEVKNSRGESAYVFQKDNNYFATVIEGLGTKNLIADDLMSSKKSYYEIIGWDTVATIVNDLATVGAIPISINAYWAVGDSNWFSNEKRSIDLIKGWMDACNFAKVSWGGGETPTLKGIIEKNACDLGGSAFGIIGKKPILDTSLSEKDRIVLIKSSGVNANGITLVREIAKRLPNGYKTKIEKKNFGELLLTKTNIYSGLVDDLLKNNVEVHYIVNITGHGLRKIMRSKRDFTYVLEKLFPKEKLFSFMQEKTKLSDRQAYATWNMGQDYALFVPEKHVEKALKIIKENKFVGLNAGFVKKGARKIIVKSLGFSYTSNELNLK